jgi:hypothetical protein
VLSGIESAPHRDVAPPARRAHTRMLTACCSTAPRRLGPPRRPMPLKAAVLKPRELRGPRDTRPRACRAPVKDRLGDRRGGSAWEPIKILSEG